MTAAQDPPGTVGASGLRERIAALVWWAGIVLVGLMALNAVVVSGRVAADMWGSGPDRAGLIWIGIGAVLVAAGLGSLGIVVVLARRGHDALAVAIGIAVIVLTRAVAIVTIPTPLNTDWAAYDSLARILATGGGFDSGRPPGWPVVLGLLYRVGGPNPLLGELANLACAVLVGVLIYLLGRRTFGSVAAAAGLFLWAISPGPALFAAALASEHLYTLLFIAAVAVAVIALDRRWLAWLAVGAILGLSQYVRPVSLILVPAFMALPFLAGLPRRQALAAAISVVVAFAIVLGPSVAWQYTRYGRLTLSTSNYDGWSLLVGLNVEHGGAANRDDLALVGAAQSTVEFHDRSYQLAIERLTGHPESIVILAVPKFQGMWGNSIYGATWTLGVDRRSHPRTAATMGLISQLAYTFTIVLAGAFLFVRRRERDPVALLTILSLGAVALFEVFLEVQPRYHAPFEPLFCLLAGGALAWMAQRRGGRPGAAVSGDRGDGTATRLDPAATRSASDSPTTSRGV